MTSIYEVIGWDICPCCGKEFEVCTAYISQRAEYCEHVKDGVHIRHKLIFIKKED